MLLLAACQAQPTPAQQAEQAEKSLLASHDTLMARMDELYDLRQKLRAAPAVDTVAAGRQRRALLAADAAMMDWMHRYQRPADSVAAARKLAYFAAQQRRIDSVAHLMTSSLDSARLVLGQAATSPKSSAQ
ncbi:hypothetical protein SAMN02745146_2661 [Hymenobacter daecheongensis DSM 21074]|uniref:Uncharacterized protein n=1 Tax=Hymenobacter daecheongensis DSM 21074 TaxID=1121955 RepID=A0A1M6HVU6_9BACT|nr:hypothetical protein SAMN02745146_2661 [Hymenobacter daecheongensis DSM 21074]